MKRIFKQSLYMVAVLFIALLAACQETPTPTPVDEIAPVIAGFANIDYVIGDPAPDYASGVTATDNVDGNLTASIVINASAVNLTTAGTYTVTYTVTDAAGNTKVESIIVIVAARVYTALEKATMDLDAFTWQPGETLPTSGVNGSVLTFESSDKNHLTAKGYPLRPGVNQDPVTVVMTVTSKNGTATVVRDFEYVLEPLEEGEVTSQVLLPFTSTSDEYIVAPVAEVPVYFVNGGKVPFIDVETFVGLLEGAIDTTIIEFVYAGHLLTISYSVEYEDFDGLLYTKNYEMVIDFTANTVTVNTFDFFESYVKSTESNYGDGLVYVDAYFREAQTVVLNLDKYRFDLIIDETYDVYLMPFHIANLIFAGGVYYDIYYNVDKLIGFDTFSRDDSDLQRQLRTSSVNGTATPQDVKEANYHFIAFTFDYFYGLKKDKEVVTYYDVLQQYADDMLSRTTTILHDRLFEFSNKVDDLHTWFNMPGYYAALSYEKYLTAVTQLGPTARLLYTGEYGITNIRSYITTKFGSVDNLPKSRLIDNNKTAIIYLTGFTIDTPNEVKAILDNLPVTVENVVIDLTYNTGGNLGAVLRIYGYMTEQSFTYHSQNPTDGSASSYFIESEYVAYNYNWFVQTSGVTFSAANLFASIAKETGVATVIGQKSSGGASSIGTIILPNGTMFMISTNNVLSTRIGDEVSGYTYLSIEKGITPDYLIAPLYDDALLISTIAQALHDQAND
jgi:hypothetical protein